MTGVGFGLRSGFKQPPPVRPPARAGCWGIRRCFRAFARSVALACFVVADVRVECFAEGRTVRFVFTRRGFNRDRVGRLWTTVKVAEFCLLTVFGCR